MRPPPTSDNSTSVITPCPSVLRCLEVLPQLHGVYNYPPSDCAISQKTLFHTIPPLISIKCYTVLFNYWWSQALTRILPNRHLWGPMYTHYVTWISDNFGPRQISVIAGRGTFAFWHTDISSFQWKLATSGWDQNLRRENGVASASHVKRNWKAKILNQRVDFLNGEVKHHHHEGIEFRVSILTTPFLREADSSRYIFSNFNAQYTQHGTKGHNDWIDCAPHQIRQICLGEKSRS